MWRTCLGQVCAVSSRLTYHLDLGLPLEDKLSVWRVLGQATLWIELVVCGIHVPPFVSFEVSTSVLDGAQHIQVSYMQNYMLTYRDICT